MKVLGIDLNWSLNIGFFYHDYHLALTTKFMEANAVRTIKIPFLMISIWAINEQWAKELSILTTPRKGD